MPRPRPDASLCPRNLAYRQGDVQRWLREGITAGNFSDYWIKGFPKYVWYKEEGIVFEGQLMDPATGTYKGYPLESDEVVRGLK
ncbi:MAG: hypothetical protein WCQ50_20535 [Spirochaetota bacterium]